MTRSAFPENPSQWGEATKYGIDWTELLDQGKIYDYIYCPPGGNVAPRGATLFRGRTMPPGGHR